MINPTWLTVKDVMEILGSGYDRAKRFVNDINSERKKKNLYYIDNRVLLQDVEAKLGISLSTLRNDNTKQGDYK